MIDQIVVKLDAGDGGAGAVSFHREKFVQEGGPDGGTGGRGGHIIAVASHQLNTLARYRRQHILRAQKGQRGDTNNRRGRDGEDLILEVPVGTIITQLKADGSDAEVLADFASEGQGAVIARGGRGGWGNTHFKSSTNRAPRVAQRGQAGHSVECRFELRLIADIGIVGIPNAGKSTLLGQLSAASPRVGAYPFTTLEPHLGVVRAGWEEFVVADLPGLIEGAAEGAGLGHEFLRHTNRTRLLIHLVDGARDDPLRAYELINEELVAYSPELGAKPQIVAINKLDTDDVQLLRVDIDEAFRARGVEPVYLSALTGEGVGEIVDLCTQKLKEASEAEELIRQKVKHGPVVITPRPDSRRFDVVRLTDGSYRVKGRQAETFIEMMDVEDEAAMEEVYRWLDRRGVAGALRKAGLDTGDTVRVGPAHWEWDA
ncbi:MAG TPA: GTPase ObgE [Dehalococcoidia bacterium]|nr:GTPase ObgE [Dehalococcoidia bacterium]